jgi:hypothetical protein
MPFLQLSFSLTHTVDVYFKMIYVCGTQNDTLINLHLLWKMGKIIAVSTFSLLLFVCVSFFHFDLLVFHALLPSSMRVHTQVKVLVLTSASRSVQKKKVTRSFNYFTAAFVFLFLLPPLNFPTWKTSSNTGVLLSITKVSTFSGYKLYCVCCVVWRIHRNQSENSS